MRDVNVLRALEEVTTLLQYLYLKKENEVEAKNALGMRVSIFMDDEGRTMARNMEFPDVPPYEEDFSIPALLGVIGQLKEQPLKEMAGWNVDEDRLKSRWDEIEALAKTNLALNLAN